MMEIIARDEIIDILCGLSDRQVEPCVRVRLLALKGRENAAVLDELLGIIDDCVYAAWTSGFEINCLDYVWKKIGGTEESLTARNALLRSATPEQMKELQKKYLWQCERGEQGRLFRG